jgi:1-acyl-sn-glycerol-3-phosphate acyltransferase
MKQKSRERIIETSRLLRMASVPIFGAVFFCVMLYDKLVFRLRVQGRENLRRVRGRGCFLISNHTLYFDPAVIAYAIMPRRARYSAMWKTFTLPIVSNFIRYLGAFPIPPVNGLQRLIRPVKKMLDEGCLVHFFPEGDLTHGSQNPAPFAPGVFFLSQLLGRPVIPVTIVLLPWTLFGREISPRLIRVTVVIGNAIEPAGFQGVGKGMRDSVDAMAQYARTRMCECIRSERAPFFPRDVESEGAADGDGVEEVLTRPSNW